MIFRRIEFAGIVLMLNLFVQTGFAQTVVWNGQNEPIQLGDKVMVLDDLPGGLSIEEVSREPSASRFVPSDNQVLSFGYHSGYHWLKFSVNNQTDDNLVLEVAQAFLPYTDLYYQDSSGQWTVMKAGYKVPLTDKIIKHHFQLFPLSRGNKEYYLRFMSYSTPTPIRLWKASTYELKAQKQKLIYGFYTGILFFIILNNIFLFFSLRRWIYLLYTVAVVFYIAFGALVMDGYAPYLFPNIDLIYWHTFIPAADMPVTLVYCIAFLELKKYLPRLYPWALGFVGYLVLYNIVNHFMPQDLVLQLNPLNGMITLFFSTILGVMAGNKGNRFGYYYALAFLIYFLIVVVEFIHVLTGNPPYIFEMSYVAIAVFVEVFILAFLLTKRFEWERRDIEFAKEEAQQQLLEKTLENERFVREQNILLEQKVVERTEQLQSANEELTETLFVVEKERQKSESLLLNILPAATARELKETGHARTQRYDSVSVILTDFKDFTESTASMDPEQLVSDLDYCFSAFDGIVQKYGLEKIKTIGDAYMAAAGLPIANEQHALNAVFAALDMRDFIDQWKKEKQYGWDIRIGIHSGPVVSGVVGTHKFAFDIWGDTVNTAARMESSCTPGNVNISSDTYQLVKDHFKCNPRGKVAVKGKGEMEMYWVERKM